jgi:hypothetical protein
MSAAEALRAARAAGVKVGVDGDDPVLEASEPPPSAVLGLLARYTQNSVSMLRSDIDARSDVGSLARSESRALDDDAPPLLAPLFTSARTAENEPVFGEPCVARRGRVEWRDGLFLHFCAECGAWGAFGYGVNLRADQLGRWYCAAHRPQGVVYQEAKVK